MPVITRTYIGQGVTFDLPDANAIPRIVKVNGLGVFFSLDAQDRVVLDTVPAIGSTIALHYDVPTARASDATQAAAFRNAGGKVVALYYAEWRQYGNTYSRHPWASMQTYQDRLPIHSVPLPSTQRWPMRYGSDGWTSAGSTSVNRGVVALTTDYTGWNITYGTQAVAGTVNTLTATTIPVGDSGISFNSPTTLATPCDDIVHIRIRAQLFTPVPGTKWRGRVYFTTVADTVTDETKGFWMPMALPGTDVQDFIIPIPTGQTGWAGQILRSLRFDLWGGNGTVMKVHSIETFQGHLRNTSTGADPTIVSATNLTLDASLYKTVSVKVRKVAGTTWDGDFYWTTVADPTTTVGKSVAITEPTWDGTFQTITIDLSAVGTWAGTIRSLRFDFGGASDWVIDIKDVEVSAIAGSATAAREQLTYGLPSDAVNAVNWEIRTAYANGIDVFAHNYYWNKTEMPLVATNHQGYSLDLHAASKVAPGMQFCIQWSNHDASNPFASVAELEAMWTNMHSYMANGRYWKIAGKPVVIVFSTARLKAWAAALWGITADNDAVKRFIDEANIYFAAITGSAAPQGIHWVTEEHNADPVLVGRAQGYVGTNEYAGFSAGTRYNFLSYTQTITRTSTGGVGSRSYPRINDTLASYEQLRNVYQGAARWIVEESDSSIPYWLPVLAGWDRKPWSTREGSAVDLAAFQCTPSPSEFAEFCRDARDYGLSNLPKVSSSEGPVVVICAWNEYGEGSVIAPTRGNRFAMVEAVKAVFGPAVSRRAIP